MPADAASHAKLNPFLPGFRLGSQLGRAYFAAQAVAGVVWWVCVFTVAPVRVATLGELNAVVIGALDIPLFVIGSALVAAGLRAAIWIVVPWTTFVTAAMVVYATITGLAGTGALLMLAAAVGSIGAALLLTAGHIPAERLLAGPLGFQLARPATKLVNVSRTGMQIAVFWSLFLVVFPLIIASIENRWQLDISMPPAVSIAGMVLLAAASALGIWAAITMSTLGDGTPLPSAMPHKLVIAGPYLFVRNPMAVAGIAQGVAVGLITTSWLVVLYALCGSLVWNYVVRPLEERDLETRFGDDFRAYRAQVGCWVPRLRPQKAHTKTRVGHLAAPAPGHEFTA